LAFEVLPEYLACACISCNKEQVLYINYKFNI
jgi:hypothetical protein